MHIPGIHLCTFSKSEILEENILPECPLKLKSTHAKACACRKRLYGITQYDLRVLSCTYPETWNGEPIRNEELLTERIIQKSKSKKKGKGK